MSSSIKVVAKIHKADVDMENADGVRRSKSTGLLLTHWLNELFALNYKAQLTDEEMMALAVAEFPKREVIQSMGAYRAYYNAGKHGHGTGEPLKEANRLPCFRAAKDKKEIKAKAKGKAPVKAKAKAS